MINFCCLVASLLFLQLGVSSSFLPIQPSLHTSWSSSHRDNNHHNMAASDADDSPPMNMSELRQRMERQQNQYAELIMEQIKYTDEEGERDVPESVHIILFHPDTPKQHVHTIEFPKNSGRNLILAFESGGDCVSFARMLQDMEFVDPAVSLLVFITCTL
mmetsp:Transcript_15049/g.25712  ORF Transcript_15049/g.25712 Transcript_15049/m.25712 type:complete len:160 (-) Transcript_15049:209-688(-)